MKAKPQGAKKRRERSELSEEDCMAVFRWIAPKIYRFCETSDPSSFTHPNSSGMRAMTHGSGYVNVQLMVEGSFGTADDFFEAIRVLAGFKLPRKETR